VGVAVFDEPTLTRLLGSTEAGRLVILCGAGLSMPPPSSLWSAQRVARACYDKWLAELLASARLNAAFHSHLLQETWQGLQAHYGAGEHATIRRIAGCGLQ